MPFHPSLKTLSDSPHDLPSDRPGKLVELLEGYGRPLMLTVPGMASALDLLRHIVLICLKNTKGRCLHRHPPQAPLHPGLWHQYGLCRRISDRCRDTGTFQTFLLRGSRLRVAGSLLYTDSRGANLSATFFLAGPCPLTMSPDVSFPADMLMADQHAPEGLVQHQQEMLTPDLILAVRSGWICPRKKRQFPEP